MSAKILAKIPEFRGSRRRWWTAFKATSPEGHRLEGGICRHRRAQELAGAVYLVTIDGQEQPQMLMGMPEIPYTENVPLRRSSKTVAATFTQKLDGTALLFSPLRLANGDCEVFPRTRGMPVLWNTPYKAWREVVDSVLDAELKQSIHEACDKHNATLVFELWGSLNKHAVSYDPPLALSLHSVLKNRSLQPWPQVALLAKRFNLPLVPMIERHSQMSLQDLEARGQALAEACEQRNDVEQGLFLEEGVVLMLEGDRSAQLWKYKPPSMAEYHRLSRRKLRPLTIRHEAFKLLESADAPRLEHLRAALIGNYGVAEVEDNDDMIRREYYAWCRDMKITGLD